VSDQKVSFPNGKITVVGNLFRPASFDKNRKYAAIVTAHPHGGVKEQTAGLYARRLAEQGFITLAYDASYWGESSGEPRNKEVPATRIEDISSAIDYLSALPQVDINNIGVLGICTGGAYALNAAQIDSRIKAVATVSLFDIGDARREGVDKSITYDQRMQRVQQMTEQRTKEARGEPVRYVPIVPESPAEFTDKTLTLYREGYEYYRTPRGRHPNADNRQVFTAGLAQLAFYPLAHMDVISPRPVLLIAGEKADTRFYSQIAYDKAKNPRELFIVPGATHMDMYDKPQFVSPAVARLKGFFEKNLNVQGASAPQKQGNPPTVSRTNAEQEIVSLSKEKWRWMSERKVDSLAALFHEEAVFVHMGGTMSKNQELDVIRSGGIQYKNVEIQEVSVRFIGTTAILLNRIRLVAVVGGNEVTNPFVVTEVYVQQSGTWKLGSLSFTRLLGQ
jgi:fermentation-respiration switch protein FrsA (DUF1100 family)